MNYENLYNSIIYKAKIREKDSITLEKLQSNVMETHHIIPKCFGGSDSKNNLVKLTFREHFLVHYLLTKIHPNNYKLDYAFHFMCNRNKNKKSRLYKKFRLNFLNKYKSENHYLFGLKRTIESREKQSKTISGKNNHFFGKSHTEESKQKMAASKLGKKLNKQTRLKMSNGYYITPWGTFFSILEAEKYGKLKNNVILRYCKNCNKKITKNMVSKSSFLLESMIGKSLSDVGFYFVRV